MLLLKGTRISFLLIVLFLSCSNEHKAKKEESDSKLNNAVDRFILKYKAITAGDSSLNKYTYSFQERFVEQQKLLVFVGNISDIFKKDSSYILQLAEQGKKNRYIIHIVLDALQFENVKANFHTNDIVSDNIVSGCFVLKVFKISSLSPSMQINYEEGHPGSEDSDATDPYISLDDFGDNRILMIRATLVDYYFSGN